MTIVLTAAVATGAEAAGYADPIAPQRLVLGAPAVADPQGEPPEAEEARTVQLGMPDPDRISPVAPERALGEFLQAWHDRAWDRMAIWAAVPAHELRRRYAVDRLRGWTVAGRRVDPGTARFDVVVSRRGMRPAITREVETFVAVKGLEGKWRVQSITRGLLAPMP